MIKASITAAKTRIVAPDPPICCLFSLSLSLGAVIRLSPSLTLAHALAVQVMKAQNKDRVKKVLAGRATELSPDVDLMSFPG